MWLIWIRLGGVHACPPPRVAERNERDQHGEMMGIAPTKYGDMMEIIVGIHCYPVIYIYNQLDMMFLFGCLKLGYPQSIMK